MFSCFFVILGHISNWYMREFPELPMDSYICAVLFNGICRVSVPIFFMISGALMLEKGTDYQKNNKRTFNLLVKTVVWTVIFIVWDFFYLGETYKLKEIFSNPVRVHFWFLYVMIGIYLTIPFWRKLVEDMPDALIKYFVYTFLGVQAISFILKIHRMDITYEVPLIGNSCYAGYFIMGYIIRHYIDRINIKKWICVPVIFGCTMVTDLLTLNATLKTGKHIEAFSDFKSVFTGVAAMTVFYLVMKSKEPKHRAWVSLVSVHSFNIYMMHVFFLDIVQENIDITKVSAWIGFPIFFIFLISFSLIFSFVYEMVKGKPFYIKTKH